MGILAKAIVVITDFADWAKLSLARQFALAGGVVMFVSAVAGGFFVSNRIEDAVVRNTANATALYMESFIAPLTQDLATRADMSAASKVKLGALLADTALGKRVVSFKIWRPGGLVVDASNLDVVGKVFPVTENLEKAWAGEVRADFNETGDEEDAAEHALGLPLLEIYSPIREVKTGKVIAVAEFYEVASQLKLDLVRARSLGWLTVGGAMVLIYASLFAVVLRGSRTIDRQLAALKDMAAGNLALRLRVQGAAARFASLNDQTLRRIGADLHDGPAQLMGFAALRLDAVRAGDAASEQELAAVKRAVKDSILEVRNISRGLSLPDIEQKSLEDILRGVAETHATRVGAAVAVSCEAVAVELPSAVKICCFRVAQEGLTNGWRHGGGLGQEVRLHFGAERLVLLVLDRGPGIGGAGLDEGGLGLAGLTDRVASLGGQLSLANRSDGPGSEALGVELRMELDWRGAL